MTNEVPTDGDDGCGGDARILGGVRLILEPLRVEHAQEMALLLNDVSLHAFIGGHPLTPDALRIQYARQVVGRSPDGSQQWLNWIVRLRDTGAAVGYVQATVTGPSCLRRAELAWVIGSSYQGKGYAREAMRVVLQNLKARGIRMLEARIHPDHHTSDAVAKHIGLSPTADIVDGEIRWERDLQQAAGCC